MKHTLVPRLLAATGLVYLCLAPVTAQSWINRQVTSRATCNGAMCTDTHRQRIVLAGGGTSAGCWEWDEAKLAWVWQPGHLTPLYSARMSYDAKRRVCVRFGGNGQNGTTNETWEYNGRTWQQRKTANTPPPRSGHAQCYDAGRGVTVIFGGVVTGGWLPDGTWEYDGKNWRKVATGGPAPRGSVTMAYDPVRRRCVLFGGNDRTRVFNDTWEWDGSSWSRGPAGCAPPERWAAAMTHVPGQGIVLFGGFRTGATKPVLADTWLYNGSWIEINTKTPPRARYSATLAYEPTKKRAMLYGGYGCTFASETSLLDIDGLVPGRFEPYGAACAGSLGGTPTLRTGSCTAPYIGEPFSVEVEPIRRGAPTLLAIGASRSAWNGVALPLDLSPFGYTGCSLLTSANVLMPMLAGFHVGSIQLTVANDVRLVGVRFYAQAVTADARANPAGAVLSQGMAATIGKRR